MRTVLGIDAAWTDHNPSGVAVAVEREGGWHLLAVEPSYDHFLALASGREIVGRPSGGSADAAELIAATASIAGNRPTLVAIDMPLSLDPIVGRRAADTAVSVGFGKQHCATHSPSQDRPGPISDKLRRQFDAAGYPLCTTAMWSPGLIEVYPHPALVRLTGEKRRLPYKFARRRAYWPELNAEDRLLKLYGEWVSIVTVLEPYIAGASELLRIPVAKDARSLKAYEDKLDAVICCVVAVRALDGGARPYGGDRDAIWVPEPDESVFAKTLKPSSPYSDRAEMRTEVFANALARGEYPALFDPKRDYSNRFKQ